MADEELDDEDIDDAPTEDNLAFERKRLDVKGRLRKMESAGWIWRRAGASRTLVHPADPEAKVWYNPYSQELLLSPKLIEGLKDSVRREKEQAGQSPITVPRDWENMGNAA